MEFTNNSGTIAIHQAKYLAECLNELLAKSISFEIFRIIRNKLAYAAFSTVPTTLIFISKLFRFTEDRYPSENSEVRRILKKGIKKIRSDIAQNGMTFLPVLGKETEMVVAIDAAFGVKLGKSSQS